MNRLYCRLAAGVAVFLSLAGASQAQVSSVSEAGWTGLLGQKRDGWVADFKAQALWPDKL